MKYKLLPYQEVGVQFFVDNNGRGLLADQMGLGKTAQALSYVAQKKDQKIMVICPALVKGVWENETKLWTNLKPLVINSKSKLTIKYFNDHDIIILN